MAMTREEFAERYGDSISELKSFCDQAGCDIMENILDDDDYDRRMNEMIREMTYRVHWLNVKEWLKNQPDSSDNYFYEYNSYDDEFYGYWYDDTDPWLESVMDWAEECGYIEEFEEDEDDEMIDFSTDDPAEDFISILKAA